jgi:hypothetical protein
MIKNTIIAALTAVTLAACGGGGGSSNTITPPAKALSLSFYGLPFQQGTQATAKVALRAVALDAASAPVVTSDPNAATVQSLQDALAALGVTANVTAEVMDGTTLHGIVMGENNGLPPTPDQFGKDPSEWLIVNFQFDNMTTPMSDPTQQAAATQFANDLSVFVNRAHVSGKQVFVVSPIPTCDATPAQDNTANGLSNAISIASNSALLYVVGALPNTVATPDHMGADCRTPDTYLLNLRTNAVAADIASRYKAVTATPPVGASQ